MNWKVGSWVTAGDESGVRSKQLLRAIMLITTLKNCFKTRNEHKLSLQPIIYDLFYINLNSLNIVVKQQKNQTFSITAQNCFRCLYYYRQNHVKNVYPREVKTRIVLLLETRQLYGCVPNFMSMVKFKIARSNFCITMNIKQQANLRRCKTTLLICSVFRETIFKIPVISCECMAVFKH